METWRQMIAAGERAFAWINFAMDDVSVQPMRRPDAVLLLLLPFQIDLSGRYSRP